MLVWLEAQGGAGQRLDSEYFRSVPRTSQPRPGWVEFNPFERKSHEQPPLPEHPPHWPTLLAAGHDLGSPKSGCRRPGLAVRGFALAVTRPGGPGTLRGALLFGLRVMALCAACSARWYFSLSKASST